MPGFNSNRIRQQERRFRTKIPYTKKQRSNGVKLSPEVVKQQKARGFIQSMRSRLSLKTVREIGTGVDFIYNFFRGKERKTLQLDLKFSYGQLGEHVIKVRLANRKLINNADWAMAVGKNNEIEFFPIKALEKYITQHYGTISSHVINKGTYSESAVSLTDFYAKMHVTPIRASMRPESIAEALKKIAEIHSPVKVEIKEVERRKKEQKESAALPQKKNTNGFRDPIPSKISKRTSNPNGHTTVFIPHPTQRHK